MLNWVTEPGQRINVGQGNMTNYISAYGTTPFGSIIPNDVVRLDDGSYRMYAQVFFFEDPASQLYAHNIIISAISSDLINWMIEPGVRLDFKAGTAYHTNAIYSKILKVPGGWRIFFAAYNEYDMPWGYPMFRIHSAVSPDGLNFAVEPGQRTYPSSGDGVGLMRAYPSNIITTDKGFYRMYIVSRLTPVEPPAPGEASFYLRSATSEDGLNWTLDRGIRHRGLNTVDTNAYSAEYSIHVIKLAGDAVRIFIAGRNYSSMGRMFSLFSNDGLNFVADAGVRMAFGGSQKCYCVIPVKVAGGYRVFWGLGDSAVYPNSSSYVASSLFMSEDGQDEPASAVVY